jgi:hypothetical protein
VPAAGLRSDLIIVQAELGFRRQDQALAGFRLPAERDPPAGLAQEGLSGRAGLASPIQLTM